MKSLSIIILSMGISLCASAQETSSRWQFSPYAGVSVSNLTAKNQGTLSRWKAGLALGTEVSYKIRERVSLAGALAYENKGCSYTITMTDDQGNKTGQASVRENLHFVTLPLYVKLYPSVNKGLYFMTGLYTGFMVSAKVKSSSSLLEKTVSTNWAETFDFGASLGVGYEFSLGKTLGQIQWRTNVGGINASRTSPLTLYAPARHLNSVLAVGIRFNK